MQPLNAEAKKDATLAQETNEDVEIVRQINHSQFEIYEVKWGKFELHLCMKLFPFEDQVMSNHFLHEFRTIPLIHPNIVRIYAYRKSVTIGDTNYSYHLTDLAQSDFSALKDVICTDEKLVRTYFYQLIDGVTYLHNHKVAHLDLKPSNMLLGEDCNLKITDFDLSYFAGDEMISGQGTKNYRALEIIEKKYNQPFAADIYSIGIVLFVLATGYLPYLEDKKIKEYDLFKLILNDKKGFWAAQEALGEKAKKLDSKFRSLVDKILVKDPTKRPMLDQIKASEWFQDPIYTQIELQEFWDKHFNRQTPQT